MAEKTVPAQQETETEVVKGTREQSRYLIPPVDIYETKDALVVAADLPGVHKSDVDVRVEDGILTINGKTSYERKGNPVVDEFSLLNFHRQFELSEAVDQEKIAAELKHGVLTIRLPKAEAAKPRQIAVKVS